MKRLIGMAMILALIACTPEDKVGKVMTGWQEGWFEIHSINTGRGECFFYILPDGTTLLVDAAGANPSDEELESHGYPLAPAKPSGDITSSQVIVDYISHYLPEVSGGKIDYAVLTHYHGDHMGILEKGMPVHEEGGFVISGITDVGSQIPFRVVYDRGDLMDRPSKNSFAGATPERYRNYLKYLEWSGRVHGTERRTAVAGALDEIRMVHSPEAHALFSVRTLAANGNVWDGKSGNVSRLPSTEELLEIGKGKGCVPENILSVAHHFKYGDFDWFAGGDCQYIRREQFEYLDIETPIAEVMGKVEGMKANHHSTKGTNSNELLSVLRPDFVIAGTWKDIHPNHATVKRFFKASPDIDFYTTNLTEGAKEILAGEGVDWTTFAGTQGHVVVKVAPGGEEYRILVLDDSDQEYRVKSISQPLVSSTHF